MPAQERAADSSWLSQPVVRIAIVAVAVLFGYWIVSGGLSFDSASLETGDACEDVLLRDESSAVRGAPREGAGADGMCVEPTPTQAVEGSDWSQPAIPDPATLCDSSAADVHIACGACETPGYDASLYSPQVPNASDVYTYIVSGCRPSYDEEIDYVKFSGCWDTSQIKDVTTTAGTVELIAPDYVKVSGISDADLPLTVNIIFFDSLTSGENRTWIWVHAGPTVGDGFTYVTGGPFCNEKTATPTPRITDTPSPTPTTPVTETPSPTPTDPPTPTPTDPPTPTPTDPPTPTATSPTEPPTDTPSPTPTDPPTDTPSPTATPTPPVTDLTIIKSDQPDPVQINGTLAYSVTVSNIGSITAENVIVTDALPANVTLISATPSQGSCDGTTCSLGSIAAGEGAVISYIVRVEPGAVSPLTNVACVASSTEETDLTNNCDEEETEIPSVTPTALEATQTPQGLPPTGGLPGADSTGGRLLLVLGLGLLLAGGLAAIASRRRSETAA